jgi:hypothetical protein
MKKKILSILFLLLNLNLYLNLTSCSTTDPKLEPELALKLEDVSCTEAWLQLTSTNIQIPNNISLLINGNVKKTFTLNTQDSILYIDSLLPNQSYKFKVVANTTYNPQPTTNEVLAQTMDTTSHNFTWQTFEFGQHSSSVLYDVAIIDENNIWAVGEIYMNDSLGNPDPKRYNAVKWNGSNWTVVRIPYNYQGEDFFNPIQSVFAFGVNDIWFCGNGVIHWDGNNFNPMPIPTNVWGPYLMNKIWGSSSNDLYVVGNNGNIAHYNGSQWEKIESGTTLHLYNIWGNFNNKTNEWEVIAAGANLGTGHNRIILSLSGDNGVTSPTTSGIIGSIHGIWFNKTRYYVVGNGVFTKKDIFSLSPWINLGDDLSNYFLGAIEGTRNNNIIACGSYGELLHFNGVTWKSFQNMFSGILLGDVALNGNIVVTVGFNSTKAFICIGKNN